MSGRVVHFEIPFDDGDRARSFYKEAFGWQLMEMPGMGYTLVMSGPSGDTGPNEYGLHQRRDAVARAAARRARSSSSTSRASRTR